MRWKARLESGGGGLDEVVDIMIGGFPAFVGPSRCFFCSLDDLRYPLHPLESEQLFLNTRVYCVRNMSLLRRSAISHNYTEIPLSVLELPGCVLRRSESLCPQVLLC